VVGPWSIVGALLLLIAACFGSFKYGQHVEGLACMAAAGTQAASTAQANADNSAAVDAIGADTADRYATDAHANRTAAHDAVERLRTVYVAADCRDVPADVLHQHAATRARINASIRGGVRPAPAGTDSTGTSDAP
jgi:hypothetical protein